MAIISNGTTIASGGSLSVSANPPSTVNTIGTYGMCIRVPNSSADPGFTISSSNLRFSNAQANSTSTSINGTWRLMGRISGDSNESSTCIWIRIS